MKNKAKSSVQSRGKTHLKKSDTNIKACMGNKNRPSRKDGLCRFNTSITIILLRAQVSTSS